jgi:purine-binding chemotaxis protein CheW
MHSKTVLVFKAGPHRYALPVENVRQIVHLAAMATTPEQPSLLAGFLNFRGRAIPVIHLRRLFRTDGPEAHLYTPLVVFECGGLTAALEAESVEEVVEIDSNSLRPLSGSDSPNNCAEAIFDSNGEEVILLSGASLLLAREKECLREFQTVVERRLLELGRAAE